MQQVVLKDPEQVEENDISCYYVMRDSQGLFHVSFITLGVKFSHRVLDEKGYNEWFASLSKTDLALIRFSDLLCTCNRKIGKYAMEGAYQTEEKRNVVTCFAPNRRLRLLIVISKFFRIPLQILTPRETQIARRKLNC